VASVDFVAVETPGRLTHHSGLSPTRLLLLD
jgi:hypothetical protein